MQTEQFHLHSRMEETHWWFTGRREIVRRLVHQVLPPAGQHTVMDIGCGTGGNLAAFAAEYRCFGWDPSEEAVGLARKRFPAVRFLSGPLTEALTSLPQAPINRLLNRILSSEAGPLLHQLRKNSKPWRARGVSFIALLEKETAHA